MGAARGRRQHQPSLCHQACERTSWRRTVSRQIRLCPGLQWCAGQLQMAALRKTGEHTKCVNALLLAVSQVFDLTSEQPRTCCGEKARTEAGIHVLNGAEHQRNCQRLLHSGLSARDQHGEAYNAQRAQLSFHWTRNAGPVLVCCRPSGEVRREAHLSKRCVAAQGRARTGTADSRCGHESCD